MNNQAHLEVTECLRQARSEVRDVVRGRFALTADARDALTEVTREVLRDIGANAVPNLLLLNKADLLDAHARKVLLKEHGEGSAMLLSAYDASDVEALKQRIVAFFETKMVEECLVIPYDRQALLGDVYESARVVAENYDETGTRLTVRGLPAAIARLKRECDGLERNA